MFPKRIFGQTYNLSHFPFSKSTLPYSKSQLFSNLSKSTTFSIFFLNQLALPPTWLCSNKLCSSKERESSRESESESEREQSLLSPPNE